MLNASNVNDINSNYYKTEWTVLYALLSAVFLLLFFVYLINILPDLRSPTPKLPGYQTSQNIFLISLFLRFIGYLVWTILLQQGNDQIKLSAFFCGIPGYFMTIAYCLIFFLWCSISMNLLLNDSSNYFQVIGKWSGIVGAMIGVLAIIFLLVLLLFSERHCHTVEMCLAIGRDLICALFVAIFLFDIIRKLKKPLCHLRSTSSSLSVMSLLLIGALIIRAASTIAYYFLINYKNSSNYKSFERGNFINTILGQTLGEVLPCLMIFLNRKKTGLLSVYDELT